MTPLSLDVAGGGDDDDVDDDDVDGVGQKTCCIKSKEIFLENQAKQDSRLQSSSGAFSLSFFPSPPLPSPPLLCVDVNVSL